MLLPRRGKTVHAKSHKIRAPAYSKRRERWCRAHESLRTKKVRKEKAEKETAMKPAYQAAH